VSRGPCLKVDVSVRMIQGQTALEKLNFFRDLLFHQHQTGGRPVPTKDEINNFLQLQMVGRTCMTKHNHIHYCIKRVCIEMDPSASFPFEDGEVTYLEYFQRRHGITLQKKQPMLHCPFRGKQELYLPSELAFLTGLDQDWKGDREFAKELWKGLRHTPAEHWKLQDRLLAGLVDEDQGQALREWGVKVDPEPVRVRCGQLDHDPIYFSRDVEDHFKNLEMPPVSLEVPTSSTGFAQRPWPEVWTRPGGRLILDKWLVFCSSRPEEKEWAARFVEDMEPLVGELVEADGEQGRVHIARPVLVEVNASSPEGWLQKVKAYQPPWPANKTQFAVVVIPAQAKHRDQYYFQLKNLFSFQLESCYPTQMVMSRKIQQREGQRQQIWRSILQQMLVKCGAFLWVTSPLPFSGRSTMVVGIDSLRKSEDSPAIQTLSASYNLYFSSYFTTWRSQADANQLAPPGPMLREAVLHFYSQLGRLPDTLLIYRAGVSECQEEALLEKEMYHPEEGILQSLHMTAAEIGRREGNAAEMKRWKENLEVAFIVVRRGTNVRFRTEQYENLPSGTYVDQ
ncbi:unnamed protein product, partial [Polarella glacialis]